MLHPVNGFQLTILLSAEDISHYQHIVVALNETMRFMSEIDAAIPKWPVE